MIAKLTRSVRFRTKDVSQHAELCQQDQPFARPQACVTPNVQAIFRILDPTRPLRAERKLIDC